MLTVCISLILNVNIRCIISGDCYELYDLICIISMTNLNAYDLKPLEKLNAGRYCMKSMSGGKRLLPVCVALLVSVLLLYSGCTVSDSFSDGEAVKLVKSFYLFSRGGREVEARVIQRGEYSGDCKCYPVTFEIGSRGRQGISKTFYIFKNKSGTLDVREYKRKLVQ